MEVIPNQPFACTRTMPLNDLLTIHGTLVNARALIELIASQEQLEASAALTALSRFIHPLELELGSRLKAKGR
jgi:hypothetical protein